MKHPTPWRLVTYTGHKSERDDKGRKSFVGEIIDAKGHKVFRGPFSFHALTDDGAEQIVAAVNAKPEPKRSYTTADGAQGVRRGVRAV